MGEGIRRWLASGLSGAAVLGLLRLAAPRLGFCLQIGPATLGTAAVLGLPGIVLLLCLRLLLAA